MPVLQFKGKTAIECYHHTVPHHTLEFDNKLSVLGKGEKPEQKVPWQKLAEDFEDETFRFQVLDEGEYADRDWRDDLKRLLESAV